MHTSTYQVGNTIRCEAAFYEDWGSDQQVLVDPSLIRLSIYNSAYELLETIPVGIANKISLGRFFCHWVPGSRGNYIGEWRGEIDGLPSLTRFPISVQFL